MFGVLAKSSYALSLHAGRVPIPSSTHPSVRGAGVLGGEQVFSLDYNVTNPLNVVITTAAMDKYLQVFALLFKIKRLEYVLVNTWKSHLTAFHSVKKLPGVAGVLHQCHLCQNQMVHFVTNLQHYIMFEVCGVSLNH